MAFSKQTTLHSININYNVDGVFQDAYVNERVVVLEDGAVISEQVTPTIATLAEIKAAVAALV